MGIENSSRHIDDMGVSSGLPVSPDYVRPVFEERKAEEVHITPVGLPLTESKQGETLGQQPQFDHEQGLVSGLSEVVRLGETDGTSEVSIHPHRLPLSAQVFVREV